MPLKSVPNCVITFKDVFVPDRNKLTHATDFAKGTKKMLKASRLTIAWGAAGLAMGAYEAAVKYCLGRVQFGKPIAQF
jgi:alkylation response protein AidB-like acyl-CoA dehydrogenase